MELEDFSNKYYEHEINRKKLSALINFSESLDSFKDWLAIEYIAHWLDRNFLDSEGERFLDHLLQIYGINYLDWAWKSPWVKDQIARRRKNQAAFFFEKTEQQRLDNWRKWPLSFVDRHKIVQLDFL